MTFIRLPQSFKVASFKEFLPYFIIGGTTTLIDWTLFATVLHQLHWHYESALVIGYIGGGLFHYTSNKLITFRCHSKKIASQYFLYIMVTLLSLLMSMVTIAFFVKVLMINKMTARIWTTLIMLVPNYLFHKHITFNKKIFIQP